MTAALEEVLAVCPYCGEQVELAVEAGGPPEERYVEDCAVCCRAWVVVVSRDGEMPGVVLLREDD